MSQPNCLTKLANERPPRILQLIHWLNPGGIESWLLAALRHVPRDRFAMDVCYKGPHEGDLAPQARATGAQLVPCPLGPSVWPFVRRLKRVLRRGRYSLLHVHTHAHSGPAVYAANCVGVPVVTTFHNTEQPPETTLTSLPIVRTARAIYARRSMRYALQKSSVANGVSQGVADAAIETARLKHACCDVFHLGCIRPKAVAADRVAQYRKELRLPCGTRVLVHVGSFQGQKNHAAILKIFRKVVETMPNAMLLLIGDGPLRPAIQEQVGRLDLDRHVRLLGTRGDATALMQLGDLFLFPSYHEGLSIALMEASAVGLPIVASDIPGNREATGDGASACLHPVDDIEGMAASVIELLDNPSACRRMAGYGREIYERTFSIEASMKRLVTLYDGVLQTHTQSRAARLAA